MDQRERVQEVSDYLRDMVVPWVDGVLLRENITEIKGPETCLIELFFTPHGCLEVLRGARNSLLALLGARLRNMNGRLIKMARGICHDGQGVAIDVLRVTVLVPPEVRKPLLDTITTEELERLRLN